MLKALSQECPAGQHWSDQFGGCASDSTSTTTEPDIWTKLTENKIFMYALYFGAGMMMLDILQGSGAKRR